MLLELNNIFTLKCKKSKVISVHRFATKLRNLKRKKKKVKIW